MTKIEMTNEEAIELIYDIQTDAVYNILPDEKEALEMAIKALKQQSCETIEEIPKDYKYDTETEDFLVYRHKYTGHEIHIEKPVPRYKLEQQPCEDCISREAVKKLKKYRLSYDTNTTIPKSDIFVKIADIEELPSVQPQRSKGKWIDDNEADSYYSNCSCCGYQIDTHYERGYLNYCPNCGADMAESEE